ncbi:Uncharacterized protein SCF082_LOCUS28656 [Durusdinium trenchii]|uniref:Uncharacterized protein n=1 Tax=Durusdinium trenchii TaxID=1381693 RepID=A0ABP0MNH0_9DINO
MRFRRWTKNKKRFPAKLVASLNSQESRNKLFIDYVKCGGDVNEIMVKHEQTLRESTTSQVQWGFRGEQWMISRHGEKKAQKLIARKKELGLLIQDPELPDDKDERLYFTLINLDMANISEMQKLTRMEIEGCIDQAGLDEFVKGGGVLDPSAGLKITDFSGNIAPQKLLAALGSAGNGKGNGNKNRNRKNKGGDDKDAEGEPKEAEFVCQDCANGIEGLVETATCHWARWWRRLLWPRPKLFLPEC